MKALIFVTPQDWYQDRYLGCHRTAPLNIATLFPEEALKQAEQDIAYFESKGQLQTGKKGRFHPYESPDKWTDSKKPERPARIKVGYRGNRRKAEAKPLITPRDQPRASSHINDNHCVTS